MATIFNFYLKFNLRCFKIINIIFSLLVIATPPLQQMGNIISLKLMQFRQGEVPLLDVD